MPVARPIASQLSPAARSVVAVNAAAQTVAEAASKWLREPADALAYGELVAAVQRWERTAPDDGQA